MGAVLIDADLDSSAPLALPAIDAVVHAAARFRFSGPRTPFLRTNVDGTIALLKATERAGAKTFVYISAAGIIMDEAGTPIRNADESAPIFPHHFSAYLASKAQAESSVLAANKPGFRTIALRPPAIWGPGNPFRRSSGDPPISRSMIRMIGREFSISDAAARRELGYVGTLSRAAGLRSYDTSVSGGH